MNPSLFSPEGLAGVIFLILIGVTVIGAIIATCAQRLIRAVVGLAICFLGVAGLYYFLNSPFVALMQLLIYVGAVCITIAFAIMLAEPDENKLFRKRPGLGGALSILCGGTITYGLIHAAINTTWIPTGTKVNDGSVKALGIELLTTFSMIFELVSVVLLIAIIGALVLARAGRD